jgi:hypothetical protein
MHRAVVRAVNRSMNRPDSVYRKEKKRKDTREEKNYRGRTCGKLRERPVENHRKEQP